MLGREAERLLGEDMLARARGGDDLLRVHGVRRGQHHRIDRRIGQHGLEARLQGNAVLAAEFLGAARRARGAGDELDQVALALHAVHQVLAPAAHADDRGAHRGGLARMDCRSLLLVHSLLLGLPLPGAAVCPESLAFRRPVRQAQPAQIDQHRRLQQLLRRHRQRAARRHRRDRTATQCRATTAQMCSAIIIAGGRCCAGKVGDELLGRGRATRRRRGRRPRAVPGWCRAECRPRTSPSRTPARCARTQIGLAQAVEGRERIGPAVVPGARQRRLELLEAAQRDARRAVRRGRGNADTAPPG